MTNIKYPVKISLLNDFVEARKKINKRIMHISKPEEKSQTTYDYDGNGMIRCKTMFVNGQKDLKLPMMPPVE